jgi:hypothetical protein
MPMASSVGLCKLREEVEKLRLALQALVDLPASDAATARRRDAIRRLNFEKLKSEANTLEGSDALVALLGTEDLKGYPQYHLCAALAVESLTWRLYSGGQCEQARQGWAAQWEWAAGKLADALLLPGLSRRLLAEDERELRWNGAEQLESHLWPPEKRQEQFGRDIRSARIVYLLCVGLWLGVYGQVWKASALASKFASIVTWNHLILAGVLTGLIAALLECMLSHSPAGIVASMGMLFGAIVMALIAAVVVVKLMFGHRTVRGEENARQGEGTASDQWGQQKEGTQAPEGRQGSCGPPQQAQSGARASETTFVSKLVFDLLLPRPAALSAVGMVGLALVPELWKGVWEQATACVGQVFFVAGLAAVAGCAMVFIELTRTSSLFLELLEGAIQISAIAVIQAIVMATLFVVLLTSLAPPVVEEMLGGKLKGPVDPLLDGRLWAFALLFGTLGWVLGMLLQQLWQPGAITHPLPEEA